MRSRWVNIRLLFAINFNNALRHWLRNSDPSVLPLSVSRAHTSIPIASCGSSTPSESMHSFFYHTTEVYHNIDGWPRLISIWSLLQLCSIPSYSILFHGEKRVTWKSLKSVRYHPTASIFMFHRVAGVSHALSSVSISVRSFQSQPHEPPTRCTPSSGDSSMTST